MKANLAKSAEVAKIAKNTTRGQIVENSKIAKIAKTT